MTQTTCKKFQTALITGSSTGIGAGAARALAEKGFRICITARREELLTKLADGIRMQTKRDDAVIVCPGDITQDADRRRIVEKTMEAFGYLDVLVNNAGTALAGALEDVSLDETRDHFELNTFAPLAMIQLLGPVFRRQESGRIINVSSVSGVLTPPGLGVYSASKYALEAFSDAARREYAPWGIKVCIIQPGGIATDIWKTTRADLSDRRDKFADSPFHEFYDHQLKQIHDLINGGTSVKIVCQAIVHAATAANPKLRYCIPNQCMHRKVVSHFPTAWEDWIVSRYVQVPKPKQRRAPEADSRQRSATRQKDNDQ